MDDIKCMSKIEKLADVRNKLLQDKLQHGKDASGYVDGVLDMYNEVKKLIEEQCSKPKEETKLC